MVLYYAAPPDLVLYDFCYVFHEMTGVCAASCVWVRAHVCASAVRVCVYMCPEIEELSQETCVVCVHTCLDCAVIGPWYVHMFCAPQRERSHLYS